MLSGYRTCSQCCPQYSFAWPVPDACSSQVSTRPCSYLSPHCCPLCSSHKGPPPERAEPARWWCGAWGRLGPGPGCPEPGGTGVGSMARRQQVAHRTGQAGAPKEPSMPDLSPGSSLPTHSEVTSPQGMPSHFCLLPTPSHSVCILSHLLLRVMSFLVSVCLSLSPVPHLGPQQVLLLYFRVVFGSALLSSTATSWI